jgi:hypothetical protein
MIFAFPCKLPLVHALTPGGPGLLMVVVEGAYCPRNSQLWAVLCRAGCFPYDYAAHSQA